MVRAGPASTVRRWIMDHVSSECVLALSKVERSANREIEQDDVRAGKSRWERGECRGRNNRICFSWNDGRHDVPYCNYRHVCTVIFRFVVQLIRNFKINAIPYAVITDSGIGRQYLCTRAKFKTHFVCTLRHRTER